MSFCDLRLQLTPSNVQNERTKLSIPSKTFLQRHGNVLCTEQIKPGFLGTTLLLQCKRKAGTVGTKIEQPQHQFFNGPHNDSTEVPFCHLTLPAVHGNGPLARRHGTVPLPVSLSQSLSWGR